LTETTSIYNPLKKSENWASVTSECKISLADIDKPNHQNYQISCVSLSFEFTPKQDQDYEKFLEAKPYIEALKNKIDGRNHLLYISNKFTTFKESYTGCNAKLVATIKNIIDKANAAHLNDPIIFDINNSLLEPLKAQKNKQKFSNLRLFYSDKTSEIANFLTTILDDSNAQASNISSPESNNSR
jgi:hypothetical protein